MIKSIKIWWLKRQARKAYLDYKSNIHSLSLSNAWLLRGHELSLAAKKFNVAMNKLAVLDENTPTTRLQESPK